MGKRPDDELQIRELLRLAKLTLAAPRSRVVATREEIAAELRAYGESALTARVLLVNDEGLLEIGRVAMDYHLKQGHQVGKALALAAVKYVEGRGRPLSRQRRLPRKPRP